jgi:hypothetical protein
MGTTRDVRWGHIDVLTSDVDENRRRVTLVEPRVRAVVYTNSEQARFAELDERQLVKIIVEAAQALDKIRQHRLRVARETGIST